MNPLDELRDSLDAAETWAEVAAANVDFDTDPSRDEPASEEQSVAHWSRMTGASIEDIEKARKQ
jgi:hypothetical protein